MALRVDNKTSVMLVVLLCFVLGGGGGYLLWRVNQSDTVAPIESEAKCETVCKGSCEERSESVCASEQYAGCGSGNPVPKEGNAWCCTYTRNCDDPVCGDNKCNGSETVSSCPEDCAKCGDNICSSTETLISCPEDCSVCGDGQCTGAESSVTCPKDCACKAMVWSNKPSGSYTPAKVPTLITVTNPNSSLSTSTGIIVQLNDSQLAVCSSDAGSNCYIITTNSAQQSLSIRLPQMDLGTYILSVSLPGAKDSCTETARFTIAKGSVTESAGGVPQTGLLDDAMGRLSFGMGFVLLGLVTTQTSKVAYLYNSLSERGRIVQGRKDRERTERKRNKFERKFK